MGVYQGRRATKWGWGKRISLLWITGIVFSLVKEGRKEGWVARMGGYQGRKATKWGWGKRTSLL
jgi:hypothetical protein